MNIAVIGAGTVGLATAAVMVSGEHEVVLVEKEAYRHCSGDQQLRDWIAATPGTGTVRLVWSSRSEWCPLAPASDVVFICVGTPSLPDGNADVSQVETAVAEARTAWPEAVIAIRSTVPPGTCRRLGCASNPEFLREGTAFEDAMNPDRIVIGADNECDRDVVHRAWQESGVPPNRVVVHCNTMTAELAKYACNCFLATKISYINGIADLAEEVGADIDLVAEVMGFDPRIGRWGLDAGLGFGGSCLPKDLRALEEIAEGAGSVVTRAFLYGVYGVNLMRPTMVMVKVHDACGGDLRLKSVAILGASFKAGTADRRGSQALALAEALRQQGALLFLHDPSVTDVEAAGREHNLLFLPTAEEAMDKADCIVIATPWPEFRELKYPEGVPVVDPWRLLRGTEHGD